MDTRCGVDRVEYEGVSAMARVLELERNYEVENLDCDCRFAVVTELARVRRGCQVESCCVTVWAEDIH